MVYECRNVTKQHCTTLWKLNDLGRKVWAGNEDDCREVTWEECNPAVKNITIMVPEMKCQEEKELYVDFESDKKELMADVMECRVKKRTVCRPVARRKCTELQFPVCREVRCTV